MKLIYWLMLQHTRYMKSIAYESGNPLWMLDLEAKEAYYEEKLA